ncbi:3'-5' exonuclease [Halobacillus naozhouensis]|uniref:Exonuclease domain-containing protein n=2 Tax=Halobacillus naozhouensis TaxID=554880 RepID=A0ABY8IX28_9BACI|nr:exonuclease domain-containing protein [Halobacillus naozhouensis]WFT73206.1 exonuclease domain-containing protein [Halobacillus naozhouensis]
MNWGTYKELQGKLREFKIDPDIRKSNLLDLDYTIFDLETTGFIPEIGHEIISIGAVRNHGLDSCHIDTFHHIIRPIRPVSEATLNLTGLTREQLATGRTFVNSLKHFLDFSRGSILVAHPAKFDVRFLQTMLKRWKLPEFTPPVIDSQMMAEWLFPAMKPQLDPLIKQFQIERRERHHALNDAMMTSELFCKLLDCTIQRDIQTFDDLYQVLLQTKRARKPK